MEIADSRIAFEQAGQAAFEHGFSLIFIELLQNHRLGKAEAGFVVGGAYQLERILLPDARTSAGAVKNNVASRPIFSEKTRLRFTELRQLVIVLLEKGRLGVTD